MSSLTATESAALESYSLFEETISALEIIADGGHDNTCMSDLQSEAKNLLQEIRATHAMSQISTRFMVEINRIAMKNCEGAA